MYKCYLIHQHDFTVGARSMLLLCQLLLLVHDHNLITATLMLSTLEMKAGVSVAEAVSTTPDRTNSIQNLMPVLRRGNRSMNVDQLDVKCQVLTPT